MIGAGRDFSISTFSFGVHEERAAAAASALRVDNEE
jgi:hypothetical protein